MVSATKPRVLLVEDDPDMRHVLAELFAEQDWDVDEAGDGAEALRQIDATRYALVVTDFWLPRFNGAEIIAYLHALGRVPPVLMMSAIPQGPAQPGVCAADAYLRKPFSAEAVVAVAMRLLGARPPSDRPRHTSSTYPATAPPATKTGT